MDKLIYAILDLNSKSEELNTLLMGIKGISEAELFTVTFNEICIVVSISNKEELTTGRSAAIKYAMVIEELSQHFTLLPMRFGSLMDSTVAIAKMIEKNYSEIQQNLHNVVNKVEFGLKVLCDSEKLKASFVAESTPQSEITGKQDAETKTSVYRDWVNKKLKEHRLEELILAHVDGVIAEITQHLTKLSAVTKFKKMLTETTIIDAVFLLEKEHKGSLVTVLEELQMNYPALSFMLTGPWPPYSFIELNLK